VEAKAIAKFVRIAPRKVQQVVDVVRGKQVDEALAILKYTPRAAAPIVEKVVKSAIANAENNNSMDREQLYISEIYRKSRTNNEKVYA
jgi:large subunit ribosomal protein L22